MLFKLVLGIHIFVCLALIVVVLLQSSKGGGLAGAFGGGGGSQTMFGGHETATFLSKLTTYLAVAFMVLSLSLALLSGRQTGGGQRSVIREAAEQQRNIIPRGESIDQILGADTTGAASSPVPAFPADTTGTEGQ